MSVPLHIEEHFRDGVLILQLEGHLVADEGDRQLRERITDLLSTGARLLLIDLRKVSYIDSGGIGAMVEMYNHVERAGGRLALLCPSACAKRVLEITHLTTVFEVFHDEDQAISSLAIGTSPGTAAWGHA
ncbi:MAG TPA: STAS domain-containing protein [Vicinamibacterales bacterium]|nr:STAS domain-containing protein [Vicinamibacterales bacterium]